MAAFADTVIAHPDTAIRLPEISLGLIPGAGGTVSLSGVLTGSGTMDPMAILRKSIRMQGIYVGSRAMFEAMNRALSLHTVRPVIDRAFPFEESREAIAYMESAAHFGKIVVTL